MRQMFVKRLNKIYAPSGKLTQVESIQESSQPAWGQGGEEKKKDKDESHNIKPLHVFSINLDPHGCLICMYSEKYDEIYIVSIVTLLNFIREYRIFFCESQQYSFKEALYPQIIIKNRRSNCNIFQAKLSNKIQSTQFLVVVYYNGLVDIYSVSNGKKIDNFDLMVKSKTISDSCSPIYNVNVIGHSVMISTYDGKLMCYEGRELSFCNKFKGEWVRIGYSQVYVDGELRSGERERNSPQIKKMKRVPIYYDLQGNLKIGQSVLQNAIRNQVTFSQSYSQSYIQYLKLQSQKLCLQTVNKKYTLSLCERYIICRKQEDNCKQSKIPFSFTIRSKEIGWNQMEGISFVHFPAINHFWGLDYGKSKKKEVKYDEFYDYYINSSDVVVAVVGNLQPLDQDCYQSKVNKQKNPKNMQELMKQKTLSIVKIVKEGQISKLEMVCKLQDAKSNITEIQWIGPNMLLFLDQCNNVFYSQISPNVLI